jgi:hypothetical protein
VQNNGNPVIQNGGTLLSVAPRSEDYPTVRGVPVGQGEIPGSAAGFPPARAHLPIDPAGYTYDYMVTQQKPQSGGRYGFDPVNATSMYGSNGVGYGGLAPIGRVGCESGSYNALNPDMALQLQTTNRSTYQPPVPGFAPFVPSFSMKGGSRKQQRIPPHMRRKKSQKKQQKKKLSQRKKQSGGGTNAENMANAAPYYFAGQIDSMKYNAPTAGYEWRPLTPTVSNNPGVSDQGTYNARHFNQACLKTN